MIGLPGIKDPANLTGLSEIKQNKEMFFIENVINHCYEKSKL